MRSEEEPFAAVAETHISVVVFVGDRAYKLKKPVDFGFCDFSTVERRAAACAEEVRLNRRLAPDVYLDVAEVRDSAGAVVEHLVVMRRMPAARRLTRLLAEGTAGDDEVRRIARLLARFHGAAATSAEISTTATVERVRGRWSDSFETMRPFAGTVLDAAVTARVEELAHRYLDGRRPLFDARIAAGRIRDGHGDLLADDIFCLDDGPRVLDCLEFDPALRHGDVLADVGFLAMDLERLGHPELAGRFLGWYRELSGETWPASLAEHYVGYRAHVRSKVRCLRAAQGDEVAAGEAERLLALAAAHLERGRVRLVMVGGLPGTGKSTLANGLGRIGVGVVLRSDEVRKDLAGIPHETSAAAPFGEGLYRPEVTAATYRELLARAERALGLGESVVLDASWTDPHQRGAAAEVARASASELVELECACPAEVAAARIRARAEGPSVSDATAAVAGAMAARAVPWPTARRIDTTQPPAGALATARAALA